MLDRDSRLALVKSCPICGGSIEHGYIGTNARVFWSHEMHIIQNFGDEPLIPRAIFVTNYVDSIRCLACNFYAFRP